jgi:hypothetical protein
LRVALFAGNVESPSRRELHMTPDEHAARAEHLLEIADGTYEGFADSSPGLSERDLLDVQMIAAIAQVHATLSLRPANPPSGAQSPASQGSGLAPLSGTANPAQPSSAFPLSNPGAVTQVPRSEQERELDQIRRDLDNP